MAIAPRADRRSSRIHTSPGTWLRLPGGARDRLKPTGTCPAAWFPSPVASLGGSSQPQPAPDCGGPPAALHPLIPAFRGATCVPRPGGRALPGRGSPASALTLLAVPFWRLPFGGDVPGPTSVEERRPADRRRTCRSTGGPACAPGQPPPLRREPAPRPPRLPRPATAPGPPHR